jgi:hypothetical protein
MDYAVLLSKLFCSAKIYLFLINDKLQNVLIEEAKSNRGRYCLVTSVIANDDGDDLKNENYRIFLNLIRT